MVAFPITAPNEMSTAAAQKSATKRLVQKISIQNGVKILIIILKLPFNI